MEIVVDKRHTLWGKAYGHKLLGNKNIISLQNMYKKNKRTYQVPTLLASKRRCNAPPRHSKTQGKDDKEGDPPFSSFET